MTPGTGQSSKGGREEFQMVKNGSSSLMTKSFQAFLQVAHCLTALPGHSPLSAGRRK